MRTIIWSSTFPKAYRKFIRKQPDQNNEIEKALRLLAEDPFDPQLQTHKLKGELSGTWACSAGYDLRIIFEFVKEEGKKGEDIFLIQIGTHDEVY
jgi:addiction module RelE/StbE family toxin